MKKLSDSKYQIFIFLFLLAFFFVPSKSYAIESVDRGYREKIINFETNLTLDANGKSVIMERIDYDFGNNEKHGIYRNLPTRYNLRKGNPYLGLSIISVTDESGRPYTYVSEGASGGTSVRIGDENRLVTGEKTYIIKYSYGKSINSLADKDRFDWNAFGNGWEVTVEKVKATVTLPKGLEKENLEISCYVGSYGVFDKCIQKDEKELVFGQNNLRANSGMTVVIDFPKDTFPSPSNIEIFFWGKPWYYGLPVISFVLIFFVWAKLGRDPKGKGTIITQFTPPEGLSPLESGSIFDNKMDKKDVSAEVIGLAVKGHIKIRRIERKRSFRNLFAKDDFELTRIAHSETSESELDKKLLDGIFGKSDSIKLSKPRNELAQTMSAVKKDTFKKMVSEGYYRMKPIILKGIFWTVGVFLTIVGFILGLFITKTSVAFLFMLSPGAIMIIFGFMVSTRTQKGVDTKEYLLGLKQYIGVAEKDRIAFHNAPEKDPKQFEKLLPYAMIFGLEKEWAEKFKDILTEQPQWYEGNFASYNSMIFASSMSGFSTASSKSFGYVAGGDGSGGGGFSGGGFGGGGGGSW